MTTLSTFVMLTLYMQQALGFSAMETGFAFVAFVAIAGTAMVGPTVAGRLVTRVGVKPMLVVGLSAMTGGLLYLTQISVGGSYMADLLPAFVLIGPGLACRSCRSRSRRSAASAPTEAGLASGLITTSQQVGGAFGIAVLSTFATARTEGALAGGATAEAALVEGFQGAFVLSLTLAALAIVAALTLIAATRPRPLSRSFSRKRRCSSWRRNALVRAEQDSPTASHADEFGRSITRSCGGILECASVRACP